MREKKGRKVEEMEGAGEGRKERNAWRGRDVFPVSGRVRTMDVSGCEATL